MFVIKNKKPLVFSADSHQEKTEWMNEISYAINQWKNSKKTLKLSMAKEDFRVLLERRESAQEEKTESLEEIDGTESQEDFGKINQAKKKFKTLIVKSKGGQKSDLENSNLASQLPSVPSFPSFNSLSSSNLVSQPELKPTRLAKILDSYERVKKTKQNFSLFKISFFFFYFLFLII